MPVDGATIAMLRRAANTRSSANDAPRAGSFVRHRYTRTRAPNVSRSSGHVRTRTQLIGIRTTYDMARSYPAEPCKFYKRLSCRAMLRLSQEIVR